MTWIYAGPLLNCRPTQITRLPQMWVS